MTSPRERILASLRDGLLRDVCRHGGDSPGARPRRQLPPTLAEMAEQFSRH